MGVRGPGWTSDEIISLVWDDSTSHTVEKQHGKINRDLVSLFIKSYVVLLLDSPIDPVKPARVIRRFGKNLTNDLVGLIRTYASYADHILHTMSDTSEHTTTGEFLEEMRDTPVFREYLHFYKTQDASTLTYLLSFLYFGKKISYSDTRLAPDTFRKWEETERRLADHVFDLGHLRVLKSIIKWLLPPLDDSIRIHSHGSGYTSEGIIDPNRKLDNSSYDRRDHYVFRENAFGYTRGRYTIPSHGNCKVQVARMKDVPKDIRSARLIVMETIVRMASQQEVLRMMVHAMERSHIRKFVTLDDQSRNQDYARAGSENFSVDTIDLSSASDSVHVDLVRAVFPAKYLYYMLGTRTAQVQTLDGQVRSVNMFAPMGSAVCFPTQCILFTGITLYAYLRHKYGADMVSASNDEGIGYMLRSLIRHMSPIPDQVPNLIRPAIYGDDIISDSRVTDDVTLLLGLFGFQVNSNKSFFGQSPIRESCGIYAYKGEDVTPKLFRIKSFSKRLNPSTFCSWIEAINNVGGKLSHLHSYWIRELRRQRVSHPSGGKVRRFLRFTDDPDAFGIYTKNKHPVVGRYNNDLQRDEEKTWGIYGCDPGAPSVHTELYAYNQWQRARIRGGSTENSFSASRVRDAVTRFRLVWTPTGM